MRGPEVERLQQTLISKGLLLPKNATGYFGPVTRDAVRRFQLTIRVPQTGTVDPLTATKLGINNPTTTNTAGAPPTARIFTVSLYPSLRNKNVTELQALLIKLGFLKSGRNTGYYGTLTEGAVRRFQCEYKIICGGGRKTGWGLVGAKTRTQLNALSGNH